MSAFLSACASAHSSRPISKQPSTRALSASALDADVDAICDPPIGWRPAELKKSSTHTHQVWISPSGDTAYGVIHFNLPLPVGLDLVLWGFMQEMRHSEGEGNLIEHHYDSAIKGERFVAEGGPYRIRAVLMVHGFEGWAWYAGTLREKPIRQDELDLAEAARDGTSQK